jgi:hypothetical protein
MSWYQKSQEDELVRVAQTMLEGKINLIEGARKICALRYEVNNPENDVFIPLVAVDSETDHYPLGKIRAYCAQEYLDRVDPEIEKYISEAREDILKACREIIRIFS